MASKILPKVSKYYSMPKPDIFLRGVPSRLPEAYKKFYKEWNEEPKVPVHYRPEPGKWKRDPLTGEVWPVQNVPIRLKYVKEAHTGLWGGELPILGFKQNKRKFKQRSTRWFMPVLQRSVVYSEILDKRLSVILTQRTIELIFDHHGFDKYILETHPSDLKSLLALKLRKKMLLALFDKTLYPDNPSKQEEIYSKYKHHLENYNKEDLEWYALSIGEAVHKLQEIEDSVQPTPLKHILRTELIQELKEMAANDLDDVLNAIQPEESSSWLKRINPFAKKS